MTLNYKKLAIADFPKAKAAFVKRNVNIRTDFQSAAVCALEHMVSSGDYTSNMSHLLEASESFGKNLNVAFMNWVMAFSWLTYDEEAKAWSKDKSKPAIDVASARAKNWWEMEAPSKPGAVFDVQKLVEALFKRIDKAVERGEVEADFAGLVINEKLMALVPPMPAADQIKALFQSLDGAAQAEVARQLTRALPAPAL